MIDYTPFWTTLRQSQNTTYTLITKHGISSATIDKLRKNKPMNTTTLNELCSALDCGLEEVARYIPKKEETEPCQTQQ